MLQDLTLSRRLNTSSNGTVVSTQAVVFQCRPGVCAGNNTCKSNRTGGKCGLCPAGFAKSGTSCSMCPAEEELQTWRHAAISLFGLVFGILYLIFCWRPLLPMLDFFGSRLASCCGSPFLLLLGMRDDGTEVANAIRPLFSAFSAIVRTIKSWGVPQYLKIFFTFLQVTTSFTNLHVKWPSAVMSFLSSLSFFNFNFLDVPGANCLWLTVTWRENLMAMTLGPLVLLAALGLPVICAYVLGHTQRWPEQAVKTWAATEERFWNNALLLCFVLYPAVSLASLKSLNCDADLNKLYTDYREDCGQDFLVWYSYVAILIYPIGVPLAITLSFYMLGVPKLAQRKVDEAAVKSMVSLYMLRTAESQRLARVIGTTAGDAAEFRRRVVPVYQALFSPSGDAIQIDGNSKTGAKWGQGLLSGLDRSSFALLLQECDKNGDGKIDLDEFVDMCSDLVASAGLLVGSESLQDLKREQMEALIVHSWPKKRDAEETSQGIAVMVEQMSVRRASTIRKEHSACVLDQVRRTSACVSALMQISTLGFDELREKTREKARELLEANLIAIPTQTWDTKNPEEARVVAKVGFFFVAYGCQRWYWELIEMARKFLLTTLIVFIFPGSPAQISAAFFIIFCFLVLTSLSRPFAAADLNSLHTFPLVANAMMLLGGMLLVLVEYANIEANAVGVAALIQERSQQSQRQTNVLSFLILGVDMSVLAWPIIHLCYNLVRRGIIGQIVDRLRCSCGVLSRRS